MRGRHLSKKIVSRLLLIVLAAAFSFNVQLTKSKAVTIIVPDDYPTVQWAINNASEGDIIYVRAGVYNETLTINKSISLIGQYSDTIIRSNKSSISVLIEADNVIVEGFSIENVPYALGGPWEEPEARCCVMIQNCNNVTLCNNILSAGTPPPPFNLGIGISMSECFYVNIVYNVVTDNHLGLGLGECEHNLIIANMIKGETGMLVVESYNNRIYHNNFINDLQVHSYDSGNIWDDGYPSGGNYWYDYNGTDSFRGPHQNETGSDGICDTSYVIDRNETDRYPLVSSWPWRRYRWITIQGDLTHDGKIDILDIAAMASMYGCREGELRWDQGLPRCKEADLARPYKIIDILDIVTCAAHYGETYSYP